MDIAAYLVHVRLRLNDFWLFRLNDRRVGRLGLRRQFRLGRRLRLCDRLRFHWLRRRNDLAMPANFDPDVVAAARGNHREAFFRHGGRRKLVLHSAKLVERTPRVAGQQLTKHADHGVEREHAGSDLGLPGRGHDVRPLASVQHQRVAVDANDCGEERVYERHVRFTKDIDLPIFRPKS